MNNSSIKQLLASPQWQAVEDIANQLCIKIKDDSLVSGTIDETVINACLKEGQVRGIRALFQELNRLAAKD